MSRYQMPPLRRVVDLADRLAAEPDELDDQGIEEVAHLLSLALDARKALGYVIGRLERECLKRMTDKLHELPDGTTLERHGARQKVRWDNSRLTWLVAQKALDDRVIDTETGEAEPKEDAVTRGLVDAYGLDTASKAPRAGWLKNHGLDPDDYREFEWGPPRLVVHRVERKEGAA